MKIEKEVKIRATARNILLSFVDAGVFLFEYGDSGRFYRKPVAEYRKWREDDAISFSQNLYYLKKKGLIRAFARNKKEYLELTPKGRKKAKSCLLKKPIERSKKKWDGKWRMVIFDISEEKKLKRDAIRMWLKKIGLIQLQHSVYVHPFDFKRNLDLMIGILVVRKYVKYIICDIIQGEEELIDHFLESNVLQEDDLRFKNKN